MAELTQTHLVLEHGGEPSWKGKPADYCGTSTTAGDLSALSTRDTDYDLAVATHNAEVAGIALLEALNVGQFGGERGDGQEELGDNVPSAPSPLDCQVDPTLLAAAMYQQMCGAAPWMQDPTLPLWNPMLVPPPFMPFQAAQYQSYLHQLGLSLQYPGTRAGRKKAAGYPQATDALDKKAKIRGRQQASKEELRLDTPGEAIDEGTILQMSFKDERSSRRVQTEVFANVAVSKEDKVRLAGAFRGQVMKAVKSQSANFVIKAIIDNFLAADLTFIMEELSTDGNAKAASMDQCGCRAVILLVKQFNPLPTMEKLVNQLLEVVPVLVRNEYGHHVVDALIEHGLPEHKEQVAKLLTIPGPGPSGSEPTVVNHAKHRRASYCVQKVLEQCELKIVRPLWKELHDHAESLFVSQSGCHVLKTLWEQSRKTDKEFHEQLDDTLKKLEDQHQASKQEKQDGAKYGLKLMSKEIQELREKAANDMPTLRAGDEMKLGLC